MVVNEYMSTSDPLGRRAPRRTAGFPGGGQGEGLGGSGGAPAAHEEDELDVTLMLLRLERGSERGRSARPAGFGPPADMDLDDFISIHELLYLELLTTPTWRK